MRKLLWLLGLLLVVVVGGVIAAPSFIDWNQYKGMASDKVRQLTGRELKIAGEVHIAVWPAPALVAEDISFSNAPGSQSPTMASFKAVEVRIALAPLFAGRIQVETVKLIEPVIELERMADGKANWEFTAAAKPAANGAAKPADSTSSSAGGSTPDIVLDNFTIENGTLIYRDVKSALIEPIEKLNATVAAVSLQGPMESSGAMVLRGIPLSYSASLGSLIQGRTIPFNAQLSLQAGDLTARANGTLVSLLEAPQFKGAVEIKGANLGASLSALGVLAQPPAAPIALTMSGETTASAKAVAINELALNIAGVQAKGDLQLDLGTNLRFGSRLAINNIDVTKLQTALRPQSPPKAQTPTAKANATAKTPAAKPNTAAMPEAEVRFALPNDIAGSLIVTVDAIGYREGVVRDVVLNADLEGGVLNLGQLSAQFPGGSDIAVVGNLTTPQSVPTFGGEVETTVNDLRGVLSWLGIAPPPVPADRLRKLAMVSQFSATPEQVQVTGLDLRFDSSRLQGGATLALRQRLGIGAAVVLDRLNVDAYLTDGTSAKKTKPAQSAVGAQTPSAGAAPATNPANPLSALAALDTFDANFNVHVKSAVYGGAPIRDLVAEGTLYNGALDLKRLSIGKLAGASAQVNGRLEGLSSVPAAKNLRFSASIADLAAIARIADTKLPLDSKKIGAVTLKGRVDGSLLAPTLNATTTAAGATATYKGRVSALSLADMLSGTLTLKHNNLAALLRRLGVDYRPAGKLGGLDLAANIKGGADAVQISDLKAEIGKTAIGGTLSAALSGVRPRVTAKLRTGALNIGDFMPAQKNAAWQGLVPTLIPATWRGPTVAVGGPSPLLKKTARGQWPTTPLDLSALNAVDADVQVQAPIIIYGRYLAEKADIAAKIDSGVLNIERLTGKLFGGALSATARAAAAGNAINAKAQVTNLDIEDALKAVTGEAAANGNMNVSFDVGGNGRSVADIVAALAGNGNFELTGMDVKKAASGSLLSGLLGLFTSLNNLGGKSADDKASASASFDIARGIASTRDLKLASAFGNGAAAGSIDLPNWTIDLNGQIALAESTLMRILKAKVRESRNSVPFAITGSLEAPDVKVDTGAVLGAGVPIPGADALLNKAPKGVGTILKGILGGATKQQSGSTPPPASQSGGGQPAPADTPPPPPSDEQQQKISPEKLLKKLFKL